MEDGELTRRRRRMKKLREFSLLDLRGYESILERKECFAKNVSVHVWVRGVVVGYTKVRGDIFLFVVIKGTK